MLWRALADEFAGNKRILEQLQADKQDLTDSQRRKLGQLISLYSNTTPIRPWDTFDLNYSTTLSINNTVLTYLVILLQFKGV